MALLVRGDHELNAVKAQKLPGVASPLRMASTEAQSLRAPAPSPASLGPGRASRARSTPITRVLALADFVCGANENGLPPHRRQLGTRPARADRVADIRNVVAGDPSPDGKGTLPIARGIEVGHIFQLGTKYSEAMGATVLDESGKATSHVHGLLRHRRDARRRRGDRAES